MIRRCVACRAAKPQTKSSIFDGSHVGSAALFTNPLNVLHRPPFLIFNFETPAVPRLRQENRCETEQEVPCKSLRSPNQFTALLLRTLILCVQTPALPFAFSGNDAIRHVAPWVSAGTMGQGLVKSLLAKYLPGFGSEPMQPEDLRAVYVPVWFVDGEVTGTVKNPSAEVRV